MKKTFLCALALCLLLLCACSSQSTPEETVPEPEVVVTPEVVEEPVTEPSTEEVLVDVVLYLPNATVDGFDQEPIQLPLEANQIIDALVDAGALPEGSEVLRMIVTDDHMDLDMTRAYGVAVATTGTAGEYMTVGSLVNTFLTAYGVTEITVTIEGETTESGHAIYDYPLEFMESNLAS